MLVVLDVLGIQISTVASESAFSTSGRVLDPYRTNLAPPIVEALVCTQDWVRKSRKPIRDNIEDIFKDDDVAKGNNFILLFINKSLIIYSFSPFLVYIRVGRSYT